MGKTLKLGVILLLVCAVSAGVLSSVYSVTSKIIGARKAEEQARSMQIVLPQATDFNALSPEEVARFTADPKFAEIDAIYTGAANGQVLGIVARVRPAGYGGPITMLVGLGADMTVKGLQVMSHSETPGLGSEITNKSWQEQFIGKGASGPLAVNKDGGEITAISSATISSRAVVRGVNAARELARTSGILGGGSR